MKPFLSAPLIICAGDLLNLGCGTDIRSGWVNLDSAELPGVDVVHDLDRLPLPFEEGRFSLIECRTSSSTSTCPSPA